MHWIDEYILEQFSFIKLQRNGLPKELPGYQTMDAVFKKELDLNAL